MKATTDRIREIAERVRAKCVNFAMSDDSEGQDYHGCEDLAMMCAVASTVLASELRRTGADPDALVVTGKYDRDGSNSDYYYENHCWVLSHGLVVDITASQFGLPEVVIRLEENAASHWRPEEVFEPGKIASDWPPEQSPTDSIVLGIIGAAA